MEIIRYQVLIPVTEVQVRSIGSGRDSACSMDGSQSDAVISSFDRPTEDATSLAAASTTSPQFMWELIHLRCTTIPGGTQRRTEKVYSLSNRYSCHTLFLVNKMHFVSLYSIQLRIGTKSIELTNASETREGNDFQLTLFPFHCPLGGLLSYRLVSYSYKTCSFLDQCCLTMFSCSSIF